MIIQVSNVLFPVYKAFIEPDMANAKLRIHSTYNPIAALTDPTYVCKVPLARRAGESGRGTVPVWGCVPDVFGVAFVVVVRQAALSTVRDKWDEFLKTRSPDSVVTRRIHDMYLIPGSIVNDNGTRPSSVDCFHGYALLMAVGISPCACS